MNTNLLKNLTLFAGLPDDRLNWLLDRAEIITIDHGEVLMEEGSLPDAFYVIIDGDVEVVKRAGQQEVVIAVRGPGEMLGEISLMSSTSRTATVRSLRGTRLLKISRGLLLPTIKGREVYHGGSGHWWSRLYRQSHGMGFARCR